MFPNYVIFNNTVLNPTNFYFGTNYIFVKLCVLLFCFLTALAGAVARGADASLAVPADGPASMSVTGAVVDAAWLKGRQYFKCFN
jgi:hypothetical protein